MLQSELAVVAKEQAEIDAIRAEEKGNYDTAKAELEGPDPWDPGDPGVPRMNFLFVFSLWRAQHVSITESAW